MNKITFIVLLACGLIAWSCSSDPLDITNSETLDGENAPGTMGGTGSADTSGNLLNFDISWDDVADTDFTDATEIIPTDEADDEYEDFVENASFTSAVSIAFNGSSATVSGNVDGVNISVNGGYVTINSSAKSVEYILSGTSSDGALKVYSDKKFKLTLNGVSLTSKQGAAVNIQSSKRAYVCMNPGTTNVLTDAASYTNNVDGEDQKACLFSEGQLLFSGNGTLTVNGNYKHGICSDEYVFVHAGTNINIASAVKDAIHTNDKIIVGGGLLKLTPSGDGMDCEEGSIDIRGGLLKANISGTASKAIKAETDIAISNATLILLTTGNAEYDSDDKDISSPAALKSGGNLTINKASVSAKSTGTAGKGMNCDGALTITSSIVKVITTGKQYVYANLDSSPKGMKADGTLTINSGTVMVSTTGGEGSEGIESKSTLVVNGGTIAVYAYDDCMNATSDITINGGNVYCYSSGNDGIDSNGTLHINGGVIVASGTTAPEEGIDCDQNTFQITGGTLLGIGGASSTPTSNVSTQCSVIYTGSATSGSLLTITASDGTHLMTYTIPRTYNQMTVLYSSPYLTANTAYTIYTGGTVQGGTAFYGLTMKADSYTNGTSTSTFTASNMVTTVETSTGGNPGGNPGNGGQGGGPGGGRP